MEWVEISPEWYQKHSKCLWDGEGEVSYIKLTVLELGNILMEQITEGTWEWHMSEKSDVRNLLLKLGAKEISSMEV